MTIPNEASIRDDLAAHLDLIETGLTLIKSEDYLPNAHGAVGFVDIHARDGRGRHVVIELKRAVGSSREAIQELYKYHALMRAKVQARSTDLRYILLSTTWHELLVPFSEMMAAPPFDVWGGQIELSDGGQVTSIARVDPLPSMPSSEFSRPHYMWFFGSERDCLDAIPVITAGLQGQGVHDFALISAELTPGRPMGAWIVYFAMLQLSELEHLAHLSSLMSSDVYEEFIADLTNEYPDPTDRQNWCAENGWENEFEREEVVWTDQNISSPERAAEFFGPGCSRNVVVHRHGRLAKSEASDAQVLANLMRDEALTSNAMDVDLASVSQHAAAATSINRIMLHNPAWRVGHLDLLAWGHNSGFSECVISMYNPDDILYGIACAAFGNMDFMPQTRVHLRNPTGEERLFAGWPFWDGITRRTLSDLINTFFDGNLQNYFFARTVHETFEANLQVSSFLGLDYGIFECRVDAGSREILRVQPSEYVIRTLGVQSASMGEFFGGNQMFVRELGERFQQMVSPFPPPAK